MAKGDVKTIVPTSVANNGSLTIQPASAEEWLVKNLYYGGAVEFYKSDGTNSIKFDSDASIGGRLGCSHLLTNISYMTIKNVSGFTVYIGYDGVQTK